MTGRFALAARAAVAAGLLALVWRAADGPAAVRILAAADPEWMVLALAALTVQTLLSAARWRLTARGLGIAFGIWHAVREYYLSQIVNQALPGGIVGDAGRAVRSRRQAGLLASGQAVVFERLAGQVALFALMAAAFLAGQMLPGVLDWPRSVAAPLWAAIVLACLLPPVLARMPGLGQLRRSLARAFLAPGVLPRQIALSLGTAVCNVAAFAFCAQAVGAALPPLVAGVMVPLILFAMLVPVTISGWGVREGAAVALFPLAGAGAQYGLAASVAFGLTFLAASLPGVALWWAGPQRGAAAE